MTSTVGFPRHPQSPAWNRDDRPQLLARELITSAPNGSSGISKLRIGDQRAAQRRRAASCRRTIATDICRRSRQGRSRLSSASTRSRNSVFSLLSAGIPAGTAARSSAAASRCRGSSSTAAMSDLKCHPTRASALRPPRGRHMTPACARFPEGRVTHFAGSVDLPQPDGPTRATKSPLAIDWSVEGGQRLNPSIARPWRTSSRILRVRRDGPRRGAGVWAASVVLAFFCDWCAEMTAFFIWSALRISGASILLRDRRSTEPSAQGRAVPGMTSGIAHHKAAAHVDVDPQALHLAAMPIARSSSATGFWRHRSSIRGQDRPEQDRHRTHPGSRLAQMKTPGLGRIERAASAHNR